MILNRLEFAMMNNRARAAFQRHIEAKHLLRLGGNVAGGRALEIGCGGGVGVEIIQDRFGATSVDAFDVDARMLGLAERRCAGRRGVRFWKGDATDISSASQSYDAVFDFGILHHIQDWESAVREIFRVLVPGGRLFAQETMSGLITHPVARRLWDHPQDGRFDEQGFVNALADAGFHGIRIQRFLWFFVWIVAEKPESGEA